MRKTISTIAIASIILTGCAIAEPTIHIGFGIMPPVRVTPVITVQPQPVYHYPSVYSYPQPQTVTIPMFTPVSPTVIFVPPPPRRPPPPPPPFGPIRYVPPPPRRPPPPPPRRR